ncbi:hypothetical protein GCM10009792_09710 [Microcella alkalica]
MPFPAVHLDDDSSLDHEVDAPDAGDHHLHVDCQARVEQRDPNERLDPRLASAIEVRGNQVETTRCAPHEIVDLRGREYSLPAHAIEHSDRQRTRLAPQELTDGARRRDDRRVRGFIERHPVEHRIPRAQRLPRGQSQS